jgi:peptidoglycan/LPS O-acetylase OafA/YrhL
MAVQTVTTPSRRGWFGLSWLRRQTSGRAYIPEIDGLRFIAIVSVVFFHIPVEVAELPNRGGQILNILEPVVHNGYRGVELFFVISGFILGLPFARHRLTGARMMRLRDYFLRRVTRLEPPYIAIMAFRAVLLVLILHQTMRSVLPHLAASLFYLHNLIFAAASTINPPAWSLEIEIQFYILAPLIAWLIFSLRNAGIRRALMVALILACGLIQQFAFVPGHRITLTIADSFQYFLAGFLLCDFYMVGWEKIPAHWLWDFVCLPLWVWVFAWNSSWYHVWLPLVCVVLYIGAFKGPVLGAFFRFPLIATIGGMCYSIYLTHSLILHAARGIFSGLASDPSPSKLMVWLTAFALAGMALCFGLFYYVVLERPCMERNWPQKLAARLRSGFALPVTSPGQD